MTGKENPLEELEKTYAQWESLYKQGGSDPFYPDGVNLNLVRNHILYFKRQIEETQPLYKNSEAYQRELPPQVEDGYMARAKEIRDNAKTTLTAYKTDPYYQYLLHHWEELDDAGLKKNLHPGGAETTPTPWRQPSRRTTWSPCAAMSGQSVTWIPSVPAPRKCGTCWRTRS